MERTLLEWPTMPTNLPPLPAADGVFELRRAPGCWLLRDPAAPLVAFTSRLGGVSEGPYASLNLGLATGDDPARVAANRERVARGLGLREVATVGQVHGAGVRVVRAGGPAGEGDVLATTRADLALAIATADCLGVVLWDDFCTALAVAHAGWRGVLAGALEAALGWLARERPGRGLRAALGPALRVCCFEVGPEVAARFPADCVRRPDSGRPHLDLALAVRARLAAAGIPEPAIADSGTCTCCAPALLYSHRRDRGVTGRHWAVARLRPAG
jgi:YfiH family protein